MSNKEIYRKTLGFSVRKLVFDFLTVVLFVACSAAGYLLAEKMTNKGLIGLAIGIVVGIILAVILTRFISYALKAGQIAMMTRGVTEGTLPDDVIGEGKKIVRERFATVALYFAATKAIRAIFTQIGRTITKVGDRIGGDTGNAVGSAISVAINTLVSYLCDCCLGWVFYRREKGSVRATCEGAVLFFRHGKTFARNMGRIFGMTLASLVLIGGVFTGILYLVFSNLKNVFEPLAAELTEASMRMENELPEFLTNPATLPLAAAILGAVILWSVLHSAFVRPFILTGVLRNYIESGRNEVPSESSFEELKRQSPKFEKLLAKMES